PHVIYLHSALVQDRVVPRSAAEARRLHRFETTDVVIAMGTAGLINGAMLIMAAATFFGHGRTDVGSLEEAYQTLTPLLGGAASTVFAISLLASGLASSAVGTMAGQVIMQGFIHRQIPVWVRRFITMLPALVVIALGWDPTEVLVISQVTLSFGIPFALVPLLVFTWRRDIMGDLANHRLTNGLALLVTALIIALNALLLYRTFGGEFASPF
ncbi:MAG TPA: Nramp family divalent metal transporter, partial [Chloroflexota bacterium]|nr:Nramp family divalent metal transporter [Chloroflexota bacterium]